MPSVLEAAERLGSQRHGWKMLGAASPEDLKPQDEGVRFSPVGKSKALGGGSLLGNNTISGFRRLEARSGPGDSETGSV